MRTKKLVAILLACFFAVAILCSCIFIFSIQKSFVVFSANPTAQTLELKKDLDQFKGKNLLFFNTEKVDAIVEKYPYFKLDKVTKEYPNVLKVEITERIPVYSYLDSNNTVYLIDQTGFIIDRISSLEFANRGLTTIDLQFDAQATLGLNVGSTVQLNDAELFNSMLSMSRAIDLTDCIKGITVNTHPEFREVSFLTKSGVTILVTNATIRGEEKISLAVDKYHNAKDYYKTFSTITVYVLEADNSIQCNWTNWNEGE